ncbi:hypothetical protein BD324DRAFT_167088 [Kockovaella imperatae]|uniref:Uncharacterized protein n=1 Tax=Kockovaella imperatae TaxID=4999 RepID=A0A1Y1U7Y6_9TREE|nr:hypothetical protein BD324DRAFT_167088 [Kockovaella imperatae]ORX34151.1 hypothetical protein BD324DRAFT_167088 [Kockovaella imperatae]
MSGMIVSRPMQEAVPSKNNPFARPVLRHEPSSFKRASLLPCRGQEEVLPVNVLSTPGNQSTSRHISTSGASGGLHGVARQNWRLLWRGGLEVGPEGWRLEGVTFFALLFFPPPTPSTHATSNPFDAPVQPSSQAGPSSSPFPSVLSGDTDLCLSLESMRGRKYLQVRGVVDLPADEILDAGEESGTVQMSISPNAPLLATYFTGLLCRARNLSPQGRTLSAVHIGLGDESLESSGSGILIYGQLGSDQDVSSLKLCVGRRKTKQLQPSEKKIRPGEPLPRGKSKFHRARSSSQRHFSFRHKGPRSLLRRFRDEHNPHRERFCELHLATQFIRILRAFANHPFNHQIYQS